VKDSRIDPFELGREKNQKYFLIFSTPFGEQVKYEDLSSLFSVGVASFGFKKENQVWRTVDEQGSQNASASDFEKGSVYECTADDFSLTKDSLQSFENIKDQHPLCVQLPSKSNVSGTTGLGEMNTVGLFF